MSPNDVPTTSVLAPLLARRARRFLVYDLRRRYIRKAIDPADSITAVVKALFLCTHDCACPRKPTGGETVGARGGGLGRADWGSQGDDERVSRRAVAMDSTCRSMESATSSE